MRSTLRKQTTLVPAGASVDNARTMEASAARRPTQSGPRVPARLLRLASDERLVEHVRAGRSAAFEVLFDRHHRGLLAFCRHMLGSPEEAEDAVQHTFMAAYRASPLRQADPAAPLALHDRPQPLPVDPARPARAPVEDLDELPTETSPRRSSGARTCATCCATSAAARGPAGGARARRARRRLPRRDRPGAGRPAGEGEGARVPGPLVAGRQPRRARDAVRRDPRRSSRSCAAARCGATRCVAT